MVMTQLEDFFHDEMGQLPVKCVTLAFRLTARLLVTPRNCVFSKNIIRPACSDRLGSFLATLRTTSA